MSLMTGADGRHATAETQYKHFVLHYERWRVDRDIVLPILPLCLSVCLSVCLSLCLTISGTVSEGMNMSVGALFVIQLGSSF